jgi:hypothetical protein
MLFDDVTFPVATPRKFTFDGKVYAIKPCQTIVWVSICPSAQLLKPSEREHLPEGTPKIPAILDTGCNSTLALREEHLRLSGLKAEDWRFDPSNPHTVRDVHNEVSLVPTLLAGVWLHAENPQSDGYSAHRLKLDNVGRGINLYLEGRPLLGKHIDFNCWHRFVEDYAAEKGTAPPSKPIAGPRLPVLGLAALCAGNVTVEFCCRSTEVRVKLHVPPFETAES